MTPKRTDTKASKRCSAEGCGSKALKGDLCERHERMANAPPCELEHCDRPTYAKGLCEAHYRRKVRERPDWNAPIVPPHCDLIYIATRVTPETKEALESQLKPGQALYGKLAEIIDDWLKKKGFSPDRAQAA